MYIYLFMYMYILIVSYICCILVHSLVYGLLILEGFWDVYEIFVHVFCSKPMYFVDA